jgi:hypothetical protein
VISLKQLKLPSSANLPVPRDADGYICFIAQKIKKLDVVVNSQGERLAN